MESRSSQISDLGFQDLRYLRSQISDVSDPVVDHSRTTPFGRGPVVLYLRCRKAPVGALPYGILGRMGAGTHPGEYPSWHATLGTPRTPPRTVPSTARASWVRMGAMGSK